MFTSEQINDPHAQFGLLRHAITAQRFFPLWLLLRTTLCRRPHQRTFILEYNVRRY